RRGRAVPLAPARSRGERRGRGPQRGAESRARSGALSDASVATSGPDREPLAGGPIRDVDVGRRATASRSAPRRTDSAGSSSRSKDSANKMERPMSLRPSSALRVLGQVTPLFSLAVLLSLHPAAGPRPSSPPPTSSPAVVSVQTGA